MLNNAQKDLLEEFFGDEGIYFETIKDALGGNHNGERFNLGTIILYLERAINQDCQRFLRSLDKLYDPNENNIELIRALKLTNDLCFNNEVKAGEFGTKKALTHFFSALGEVNPGEFKTAIQDMIKARIATLSEGKEERIIAQKKAREDSEDDIVRRTGWRGRDKLNLPLAQQDERSFGLGFNRFFNALQPGRIEDRIQQNRAEIQVLEVQIQAENAISRRDLVMNIVRQLGFQLDLQPNHLQAENAIRRDLVMNIVRQYGSQLDLQPNPPASNHGHGMS